MEKWKGKVAVVTGASSGIGAEIALTLARANVTVIGVARNKEAIENLKQQLPEPRRLIAKRCDIANQEELDSIFQWVIQDFGGIDILVNNAAVFFKGTLNDVGKETITPKQLKETFAVNVIGMILGTRWAIHSMRTRNVPGHIINMNSIAGHGVPNIVNPPPLNAYTVTKNAVTALTQVTRLELAYTNTRIKITSISPGAVDTDMLATGNLPEGTPVLQPKDVAAAVVYALSSGPDVNISEITVQPLGEIV